MTIKCTMILGDCLEVMPTLLKTNLVIADLPFGVSGHAWDKRIPLKDFWAATKQSPCLAFANRDFMDSLIQTNRKAFRYEMIWDQGRGFTPLLAHKMPIRSHTFVLYFSTHGALYSPIKTTGHDRVVSVSGNSPHIFYGDKPQAWKYDSTERFPTSVLRFGADTRTRNNKHGTRVFAATHPSAKPVALLEWLIKSYSTEEAVILDPTAGSFSSAIAALSTGRSFIGIEADANYFEGGVERVGKHVKNNALPVMLDVVR